jgi:hypothetical protein
MGHTELSEGISKHPTIHGISPHLYGYISHPHTDIASSLRVADSILSRADQLKPAEVGRVLYHLILRMQGNSENDIISKAQSSDTPLLNSYSQLGDSFLEYSTFTNYRKDYPKDATAAETHLLTRLIRSPHITYETLHDYGIPLAEDLILQTGKFDYAVTLQRGLTAKAKMDSLLLDPITKDRFEGDALELAGYIHEAEDIIAQNTGGAHTNDSLHKVAAIASAQVRIDSGQYYQAYHQAESLHFLDQKVKAQVMRKILRRLIRVVSENELSFYMDKIELYGGADNQIILDFALSFLARKDAVGLGSPSRTYARKLMKDMNIFKDDTLAMKIRRVYGSDDDYINALIERNAGRSKPKAELLTHMMNYSEIADEMTAMLQRDLVIFHEALELIAPNDRLIDTLMQTGDDSLKRNVITRIVKMLTGKSKWTKTEEDKEKIFNFLKRMIVQDDVKNLWGGLQECNNNTDYIMLLNLVNTHPDKTYKPA